jgi:hypothetical protein
LASGTFRRGGSFAGWLADEKHCAELYGPFGCRLGLSWVSHPTTPRVLREISWIKRVCWSSVVCQQNNKRRCAMRVKMQKLVQVLAVVGVAAAAWQVTGAPVYYF